MDPKNCRNLTDMHNIGKEVARLLSLAGINTPEELVDAGAVEAAVRIRNIRPDDPPCRSMLAGLYGSIIGVRWHTIPKPEREKIWLEYQLQISNIRSDGNAE